MKVEKLTKEELSELLTFLWPNERTCPLVVDRFCALVRDLQDKPHFQADWEPDTYFGDRLSISTYVSSFSGSSCFRMWTLTNPATARARFSWSKTRRTHLRFFGKKSNGNANTYEANESDCNIWASVLSI